MSAYENGENTIFLDGFEDTCDRVISLFLLMVKVLLFDE
jgi:hypothetical protein